MCSAYTPDQDYDMISLLFVLSAFFIAVGGHYFLPLGHLAGAGGAEILLDCAWAIHPESILTLPLLAGAVVALKWRRGYYLTAVTGLLVIAHGVTLEPASFFLGETNSVLVLADRTVLRSHLGLDLWLITWGAFIVFLSAWGRFRRVKSVHRPSILLLARRNLRRKVFRSAALATGVGISVGAVFAYTLLMETVEKTLEIGAGRLGADIMVVPEGKEQAAGKVLLSGEPSFFYMDGSVLDTVLTVDGVEKASAQVYIRPYAYRVCCTLEQILIVGYDPKSDFTVAPWVEYALGTGEDQGLSMVVGRRVKYYPGQTVELYGHTVRVSASLDPTGLGYFDHAGFMPMAAVRTLSRSEATQEITDFDREARADLSFTQYFEGKAAEETVPLPKESEVSTVFVKVSENALPARVAEQIEKTVEGVAAFPVKEATRSAKQTMTAVLKSLGWPILIMWFMAAGMVAGAFALALNERRREIGMLRAMGATRANVALVVALEAVELTGLGGILGLAAGGTMALLFKGNVLADLGLLYIWPRPLVVCSLAALSVLASIATGVLAGLYPALRSARLEPYDSIRRGER